jgi:hypothetical protein
MILEVEPEATTELFENITEEAILGNLSCKRCRRPSVGSESLLVAKSGAPLLGNTPREYALWEGGIIADG